MGDEGVEDRNERIRIEDEDSNAKKPKEKNRKEADCRTRTTASIDVWMQIGWIQDAGRTRDCI